MRVRRLAALLIPLVVAVALAGSAAGQSQADLDELRQQIDRLADQIESAEAARSEAAAALLAARARLDGITAQVRQARQALASLEADIAAGEAELAALESALERTEADLAATRLQIGQARDRLAGQVVELYMNASLSSTRLFVFSDATEAAVGFAYVEEAMAETNRLRNGLLILEAEAERTQEILDAQRLAASQLLVELGERREAQAAEVARVERLEAEAAAEARAAEQLAASITAEIAHFEDHMKALEADAAALERELAARNREGDRPQGQLARPVPGPVTSPYGYRIHPIFGISLLHTGWDLSAASGQPIVAAASGEVVSAGVRGGYGNATVIDHGGGMATLYAHQSSMAVSAGQRVERGQVIGYVGCTGYCTGPHLHFEVRINGVPVDPAGYLSP